MGKPVTEINEALGRVESQLFSELEGETVVITAAEFGEFQNKGETVKQVILTVEGKDMPYRSSGKAILDTIEKVKDSLPVRAKVVKVKSKGSKYSYISLAAPEA